MEKWLDAVCILIIIAILSLFLVPREAEGRGVVQYTDFDGTEGLSVFLVDTSECGGTPPNVTIDGGATSWVLYDVDEGRYILPLGPYPASGGNPPDLCWYHVFVNDVWQGMVYVSGDTLRSICEEIFANGFVTEARIADGAVTTSKLCTLAVTMGKIAESAVTSAKIADATVVWADVGTSVKGSVTPAWTLNATEDTVIAMKGDWHSGDFTMGQMDSLHRLYNLGLTFSACTVRTAGSSREQGVHITWRMNSAHNDSSVARYEIWVVQGTMGVPLIAYGKLNAAEYEDIGDQMMLYLVRERPGLGGGGCYIPGSGWIWTAVVAVDWDNVMYVSALLATESGQTGIGSMTTLTGAPGFTTGMDLISTVRDALFEINVLKSALSAATAAISTGMPIMVYADQAATWGEAYNTTMNPYGFLYRVRIGGPPARKVGGVYKKFYGYNRLRLTCEARMYSIGSECWLYFDDSGLGGGSNNLFGASDSTDTLWTKIDLQYDITFMAADSNGTWCLGGASSDTVFIRNVTVVEER